VKREEGEGGRKVGLVTMVKAVNDVLETGGAGLSVKTAKPELTGHKARCC
jgi:hypothetical protein